MSSRRTATVTVLFCDLVGSTERQARLGDEAADEFRARFFRALTQVVRETDGDVVKNTGDGLMVVYRASAVDAVTAASRMHDHVEALEPDDPARLRAGISAGEAASENDDWFGTPVVEAARLCGAAEAGQTLVTEVVRSLVGSRGGHQFRSLGSLSLKGLADAVPAAAVVRTQIAAPPLATRQHRRWAFPVVVALLVIAAAVALVVADTHGSRVASVTSAKGYTPRVEPKRCPSDLTKTAPGASCGVLVVPQDRTRPDGRLLRLPYERIPPRHGRGTADPTIALDDFGQLENVGTSPARDHSELVVFSTRVSESPNKAMACHEYDRDRTALLGSSLRDPKLQARITADVHACYVRLINHGIEPSHYTFVDGGDDVVDLIRALGYQHVNLSAANVSDLAAFEVVRSAPNAVRTLTLENPIPPGPGGALDLVGQLARTFDHYADLCRQNATCNRAYPDLPRTVAHALETADRNPISVNIDPYGLPIRVRVDRDHATRALAAGLADSTMAPEIAAIAAAKLSPPVATLVANAEAENDYFWSVRDFPLAVFLSTRCSYIPYVEVPSRSLSSATRPQFAGFDYDLLQSACAGWPVPKGPDLLFATFASPVPTFIVEGELAWWVTPEGTAQLQSGLPNSQLVRLPTQGGGGHGLLYVGIPTCIEDLRRTFLEHPARTLDTAACNVKSQPIPFATPLR